MANLQEQKDKLEKRLDGMKKYLLLKYEDEDWHGCMDAAADIREIVAELKCIKKLLAD